MPSFVKTIGSTLFAGILATVLPAADASAQITPKTCSELHGGSGKPQEMVVNFEGQRVGRFRTLTPAKARAILNKFIPEDLSNLQIDLTDRQRIKAVLNNPQYFDRMYGTRGLLYMIGLRAAEEYMLNGAGRITRPIFIDPWGKIDDGGYKIQPDMSGHIYNTMCFEIYTKNTAGNKILRRTYSINVKTKVNRCGFRILPRQDTDTDNDPIFPGSLIRLTSQSNIDPEFTHKLQVVTLLPGREKYDGSACRPNTTAMMEVTEILFDDGDSSNNGSNPGQGSWEPFAKQGEHAHYYVLSATSCIDMLFRQKPPRDLQPTDTDPPYCLGRCTDPLMVNSGL